MLELPLGSDSARASVVRWGFECHPCSLLEASMQSRSSATEPILSASYHRQKETKKSEMHATRCALHKSILILIKLLSQYDFTYTGLPSTPKVRLSSPRLSLPSFFSPFQQLRQACQTTTPPHKVILQQLIRTRPTCHIHT